MSLATILLVGNVGVVKDAREVNGGTVREFSLAVNTKRGNDEIVNWYNVSAWRALAPVVDFINKGDQVVVVGALVQREYTKKDGTTGYELSVTANNIQLPAKNRDDSGDIPF